MKLLNPRNLPVCALVLLLALAFSAAALTAPTKGQKAPDVKATTLDGKTVSLSDLMKNPRKSGENRVTVLDFWATWCPPCREEVPHLQALYEKYGKEGVEVIGISIDNGGANDVKPFVKERKLTYTVLVDPGKKSAATYGVRGIPATFIMDKKGVIRETYVGFAPEMAAQMESTIKTLLKE